MSEMIERVAQRLSIAALERLAKRGGEDGSQAQWTLGRPDELRRHLSQSWPGYVSDARAVIEAMREPTEAMLKNAYAEDIQAEPSPNSERICWQAMIDAALDPQAKA